MRQNLISKIQQSNTRNVRRVHQPHISIEFDNIRNVPDIYVDGVKRYGLGINKPLISVVYDWYTSTDVETENSLSVKYIDEKIGQIVSRTISNDAGD